MKRRAFWLYRYYQRDGVLLYVGIAQGRRRLAARHGEHRNQSRWFTYVYQRRVKLLGYMSRENAEAIEREIIMAEHPIFNVQHAVGGRQQRAHEQAARRAARRARTGVSITAPLVFLGFVAVVAILLIIA